MQIDHLQPAPAEYRPGACNIGPREIAKRCAGLAYAGIRSVNGSDATESVANASDLAVDRAAASRLVAYCGAIAAAITAVFAVLPV